MESLQQICDGSLDKIVFPKENEFAKLANFAKIKQEPQNYDLSESEYDASNFVETEMAQHYDVKPLFRKKPKKIKKIKDNENGESKRPKPFKCTICGKGYVGLHGLQYHVAIVHEGKRSFTCEYCPKTFKSKGGLQYHTTEHELKELGVDDTNINEHMENPKVVEILRKRGKLPKLEVDNSEKLYKCEFCDKSYSLNMSLIKHHINNHDVSLISTCHLCSMKFQSKAKLEDHIKVKHSSKLNCGYNYEKKFKCDLCGKRYTSARDLDLHTAVVHEGKKPFACDLCPMAYTAKDSLRYHVTVQHELKDQGITEENFHEHSDNPRVAEILRKKAKIPKKMVCKLCNEVILDGALGKAKHMREKHCDETGNFKCPQCDAPFRKYELRTLVTICSGFILHIVYCKFLSIQRFKVADIVKRGSNTNENRLILTV